MAGVGGTGLGVTVAGGLVGTAAVMVGSGSTSVGVNVAVGAAVQAAMKIAARISWPVRWWNLVIGYRKVLQALLGSFFAESLARRSSRSAETTLLS